jgi:hypothetical protein
MEWLLRVVFAVTCDFRQPSIDLILSHKGTATSVRDDSPIHLTFSPSKHARPSVVLRQIYLLAVHKISNVG